MYINYLIITMFYVFIVQIRINITHQILNINYISYRKITDNIFLLVCCDLSIKTFHSSNTNTLLDDFSLWTTWATITRDAYCVILLFLLSIHFYMLFVGTYIIIGMVMSYLNTPACIIRLDNKICRFMLLGAIASVRAGVDFRKFIVGD